MANGNSHRVFTALTVGGALMCQDALENEKSVKPLLGATLCGLSATLPDLLEPANVPHHRKFFHSVTFAAIVGGIAWKVKEWQPEDAVEDSLRFLLLAGCSAYLIHLGMDALTKRSLPLLGKF